MASGGTLRTARASAPAARLRGRPPAWSAHAWGAIGVVALFVALTIWWLTQDRRVPYGDAAEHLHLVLVYRDALDAGDLLEPFTSFAFYPPVTLVFGALSMLVGGVRVATPVVAQNLVYAPLLALGCFQTARLWRGSQAGLLAVVFAFGSPLVIEQFHVFMLDVAQAALVAVAVWLLLASARFERTGVAALAGLVTGVGTASKQLFPFFVVGLLAVLLARGGGWRNVRGVAAYAVAALAVGSPWYLYHWSNLGTLLASAGQGFQVPPLAAPALLSTANLEWYAWAILNGLLFLPLFALALAGTARAAYAVARERSAREDWTPELLGGLLGSWVALSAMKHHDLRYTMPLIVYLSVLGTGWIVGLRSRPGAVATLVLVLAALANTLGMTFGVGGEAPDVLPGNRKAPRGEGVPAMDHVTVYANHDFLVSGPRREGDVFALLQALRADGVANVAWPADDAKIGDPYFNQIGLAVLTDMADVPVPRASLDVEHLRRDQAFLIHRRSLGRAPPCLRLGDGLGVWVVRGGARAGRPHVVCPSRVAGDAR